MSTASVARQPEPISPPRIVKAKGRSGSAKPGGVTDDLLFPGPQTDDAPKRADETMWAFINRASRGEMAAPRAVLEDWFAQWPADDRPDLRGRLGAKDDRQFRGAF
jgi:hypothetical protein